MTEKTLAGISLRGESKTRSAARFAGLRLYAPVSLAAQWVMEFMTGHSHQEHQDQFQKTIDHARSV